METLYLLLVFLHLLGMAGIISGWLMQVLTGNPRSRKVLLHSALLQLVVGLALVAFLETGLAGDGAPDHVKIGVKLIVAVAVVVLGVLNLRKPSPRLAHAAGVLTVLNVGVAVFW